MIILVHFEFFLINEKCEVRSILPHFCKNINTQFQISIKQIHSYNRGEFLLLKGFSF